MFCISIFNAENRMEVDVNDNKKTCYTISSSPLTIILVRVSFYMLDNGNSLFSFQFLCYAGNILMLSIYKVKSKFLAYNELIDVLVIMFQRKILIKKPKLHFLFNRCFCARVYDKNE